MNPKPRFSFSVASAIFIFVLLCFAPGALGQSANNGREASSGIVLSQTLPGLFVFGLDPHHHDPDGCDAEGKGGHRGKCSAVPEGGTALAYVSLVALGCLATGIFRIRRQARLRETK